MVNYQSQNNAPEGSQSPFIRNTGEILWNIINSLLASAIAFFSACLNGGLTKNAVLIGFITGLLVGFIKFKAYWENEEEEYRCQLFSFL